MNVFTDFSIGQILFCSFGLILALKGGIDLFDYFKGKYQEKFNKDYAKKQSENNLLEHYENCQKQHEETRMQYEKLSNKLDEIDESITEINRRVDNLTESDKHDIKQAIVKDYHYFVDKQKWIDDFSLDTLELRYRDYQAEGGNSYIADLMTEIRNLPKHPPQE